MLQFTALNTATGDSRVIMGLNIADAYRTAKKHVFTEQGANIRVYPHCETYLAVQIAKTVSRKTLSYMETPTQRKIMDCLDRGTGKFNHSLSGTTSDYLCTAFFNSLSLSETDEHGTVIKPCVFNHDTQDFISFALLGVLSCDGNIIDKAHAGFRELNRYIETQRTRRDKEVLTAYDIETDAPLNTEIRRIVKGLTDSESQKDITAKDSELATALQDVSATLTAVQRDIFYRLGKGHSLYRVAKDMHRDKKTIKEHRGYIQKKALKNDSIRLYLVDNHSPLAYNDNENTAPTDEQWTAKNTADSKKLYSGFWTAKSPYNYTAPIMKKTADRQPVTVVCHTVKGFTVWTKDGQPKTRIRLTKLVPIPAQDSKKALISCIRFIMDSHRGTAQYRRMMEENMEYIHTVVNLNQTALYSK